MRVLPELASGELVLVFGKGGVGKSAVAAAIAWHLAEAGRRTLLLEVDPRETLHELAGVAPSGGEPVAVRADLVLQSLRPRQVIDREILDRVPVGWVARRVVASPIFGHFVDGAPGLEDVVVLEHLRRSLAGGFDVAVVDGAATGHALAQLRAPGLLAEAVRTGPFARLAARLAGLVKDPSRTRAVLVSQAEEMPVEETFELARALREEIGLPPALLVLNQLIPDDLPARRRGEPEILALWRERRELQRGQRERLLAAWPEPVRELPWLALPRGPRLVSGLAALLSESAGGGR